MIKILYLAYKVPAFIIIKSSFISTWVSRLDRVGMMTAMQSKGENDTDAVFKER